MSKYNDEFKEQLVRKMMSPNALSVAQVSRDTGVSDLSLYHWRNQFAQGKHKKVALTACMRKMITILNAMVRDQKEWQMV